MKIQSMKGLFQGSLPAFPHARGFGDTIVFLMLAVFMTFGFGAVVMMFLEPLVKGGIGLISSDARDFVFIANADAVAAVKRLLSNAMDCGAAMLLLWSCLQGKPLAETISLNMKRLRFGWIQAVVVAFVGFAVYRGAIWLIYDHFALVQSAGSGNLVNTAKQLSGVALGVMMFQTLVVSAILEEVVHRGLVYNILRSSLRISLTNFTWLAEVLAVLIGAGMFTIIHVFATDNLLPIFIGAVIMTELYRRTGSLVVPILMHSMLNGWIWYTILS